MYYIFLSSLVEGRWFFFSVFRVHTSDFPLGPLLADGLEGLGHGSACGGATELGEGGKEDEEGLHEIGALVVGEDVEAGLPVLEGGGVERGNQKGLG